MKTTRAFKEIIISNVGKLNKEDILSNKINDWISTMVDSHFDFHVNSFQYQTTETRHSVLIFYETVDLENDEKAYINNDMAYITKNEVPTTEEILGFSATSGLNPETGEWGHNA